MRQVKQDSADITIEVLAVDAITGQPRTGLVHTDVAIRYVRTRLASVSVAAASLASPSASHADGGFIEIDASGCPGLYRVDLPDAAFANGAAFVATILTAESVLFSPVGVELVGATVGDLATEVHLCKAALVNKRVHTVSTGVDEIKDDDGSTTIVTMTPTDGGDDVIEVIPS